MLNLATLLDFLNPLNVAAEAAKNIVDVIVTIKDRHNQETTSIIADLTDLMEELRKTHSTIVKLVSPLRRIADNPGTFTTEFNNVYFDFRDFYDAFDFGEARTHCHKIRQIQFRMAKRKPHFGPALAWTALDQSLSILSYADFDIIDNQYKPFMKWFDDTLQQIKKLVDQQDIAQAIATKQKFLAQLGPAYDHNKAMLEQMTDTIGQLTTSL